MLYDLLREKKKDILSAWMERILNTYPADAARFMRNQGNQFANPVGSTYGRTTEIIFDALIEDRHDEKLLQALDQLLEIRAVQDFTPSQALAILFLIKPVIHNILPTVTKKTELIPEIEEMDNRIDGIALLGFDRYSLCRDKIHHIKLNEVKRSVGHFMERFGADIIVEEPKNDEVFKMAVNDKKRPKGGSDR